MRQCLKVRPTCEVLTRQYISACGLTDKADSTHSKVPPVGEEDSFVLRERQRPGQRDRVAAGRRAMHFRHTEKCQQYDGRRPSAGIHGKVISFYCWLTTLCCKNAKKFYC